jgi:hypothetical protein
VTVIGYQHGIVAGMNGLRDLDPSKTLLKKKDGKWPSIDTLEEPLDSWKAWDKMERAFTILVHDHDAAQGGGTPDPPVPPVQSYVRVAPIVVREEGGSDQRVCLWNPDGSLRPGCFRLPSGQYGDESGALYRSDGDGLEDSSIRSKVHDERLVGARSMDNRAVCDCPPVGNPEDNSGSWTV